MQRKTTKNGPKSTNIWSKIDEILMKCVENVPKSEQKPFFSDVYFLMKKRPKKDDSMAPGGWT